MWFKNLCIFIFKAGNQINLSDLTDKLSQHALAPCTSMDMQTQGWTSPREKGPLVQAVGKQFLIALGSEKKLLPSSVIKQYAKVKAEEIEDQQGFKPGRKQMKEIKEAATDELLPKAFTISTKTLVWLDTENDWLVINASSASKVDDAIKFLLKSMGNLQIESLRVGQSPVTAMTDWLAADEAPHGFTIDSDTELSGTGLSKSKVRYVKHTLEHDDVRRHITAGKQCTRLALTWSDRISFVLTDNLTLKKITPLDVIQESADKTAQNDDERFDADFLLMAGELNKLVGDVVESLGGFVPAEKAA